MVKLATLTNLERLEREMADAGRVAEEKALREARHALARPPHGLLTTGQAAERLGISIPTVKRWLERGTLDGGRVEGRWLVATESVERLVSIRDTLRAIDAEGYPTDEELQALFSRSRRSRADDGHASARSP
jgi:excisionase family DNA binding protein